MRSGETGETWLSSKQKRIFDLCFSSTAAALAAPLGVAALVAVMIENRHPPVFLQERIGNPEQELLVPKLRTLAGPIENRPSEKGHNHPRAVGKLSRLVRRLHLDELPQVPSVLIGDMSVVGPRPVVEEEFEKIMDSLSPAEQIKWIEARKAGKPGLVNSQSPAQHTPGYENNPRSVAEADILYAETASWEEDQRIILETTRAVIADLFAKGP